MPPRPAGGGGGRVGVGLSFAPFFGTSAISEIDPRAVEYYHSTNLHFSNEIYIGNLR
jgi:hypothetical protein